MPSESHGERVTNLGSRDRLHGDSDIWVGIERKNAFSRQMRLGYAGRKAAGAKFKASLEEGENQGRSDQLGFWQTVQERNGESLSLGSGSDEE